MTSAATKSGTFNGVQVSAGEGGGLASAAVIAGTTATHYHAARLPQLGDTVLAVARVFDPITAASLRIELRAFAAGAAARSSLALLDEQQFVDSPGALAFAHIDLAADGEDADERRPATLRRCIVTDAVPTAGAAQRVASWLRDTWEIELAFGSWPALQGQLAAFATNGGAPADWARDWLRKSEHQVDENATDQARFLKVLSPAWLE